MSPRAQKYGLEPARLNIKIERDLLQRFKAACALNHANMTDVLVKFVQGYVDSHLPKSAH